MNGTWGRTRTGTVSLPPDFESNKIILCKEVYYNIKPVKTDFSLFINDMIIYQIITKTVP